MPLQRFACLRSADRACIELQAEAVRKAREVVEYADDVRDFEDGLVVEAQIAQRLPVFLAGRQMPRSFGDILLRSGLSM
jgi:hypothetical protein